MNATPRIAIVADDLTGACDTAACFGRAGLATLVASSPHALPPPECDVVGVSTESRELSAKEAEDRARLAAERLAGRSRKPLVYKKMDSTLRGHFASELKAMMDVLGVTRALAAPAFPAQGRTTLAGRQLVDGLPVMADGLHLLEIFRRGMPGRAVRALGLETIREGKGLDAALNAPGVVVADAQTDADLAALAQAALKNGIELLCGSAGLARALAEILRVPGTDDEAVRRSGRPVLVVAGSRHPRTASQVEFAARKGISFIRADARCLQGDEKAATVQADDIAARLDSGRDVILTTLGAQTLACGGRRVADRLAGVARAALCGANRSGVNTPSAAMRAGGLVLTGGAIAAAVCEALPVSLLRMRGEVEPGVPFAQAHDGPFRGLPLVTKAGGFGGEAALYKAIVHLRGRA